jgi:ribosomal protein S18 acetylase RimI-like enzyme
VHYRLYVPEDFAALYGIEEVCFQPPFRFDRRQMHRLVGSSNSATWIAEESGTMGGFAIIDWTREADEVLAYIQTIEVAPHLRGQGIGGALLQRVEDSARAASAQAIWLHVAVQNALAIRVYESHGYERKASEEDYYGPGLSALVYLKLLGT